MGNTVSSNINQTAIQSIATVTVKNAQNCSGTASVSQSNTIVSSGKGSVVNYNGGINQEATISLSASCVNEATNKATLDQTIDAVMKQAAKTISQNMNLNFGETDASNTTNLSTEVKARIDNQTLQTCVSGGLVNQQNTIASQDGGTVNYYGGITQTAAIASFTKCMQQASNNSVISQKTTVLITQVATAIMKNALAALFLIFVAIIIALAVAGVMLEMFGGTILAMVMNPKFLMIAGFLVFLGLSVAAWAQLKPFNINPNASQAEKDQKERQNKILSGAFPGLAVACLLAFILFTAMGKKPNIATMSNKKGGGFKGGRFNKSMSSPLLEQAPAA